MMRGILLLSLLLSGCGLSTALREVKDVASPSVVGEIVIRGSQGEPVTWTPDTCLSGEHEQFFGFILLGPEGSNGVVMRAVADPLDGPGLRLVGIKGARDLVLRPDSCERLDLVVEPTGWRVNDFQDLSGTLDVSCESSDGASLEGSLEIQHCH